MKKTPDKRLNNKDFDASHDVSNQSASNPSVKSSSDKCMDTMTPAQMKEMIDWFNKEMEQLTKDIRKYNDAYDYYRAAQAEGMRDSYHRCIKKLYELNELSG